MIVRRVPHVVVGMLLASFVVVAPPAPAAVRAGDLDAAARFLLDDAPSFFFPGAMRGEPIEVGELSARPGRDGFTLHYEPVVQPDSTAGITMRISFYPADGRPWGLQWDSGDTKAEVVRQNSVGTPDELPTWTGTGSTRQIQLDSSFIEITVPVHFLEDEHLKLPDLTGVQVQHEVPGDDESVTFQGSPIVDWGALLGHRARVELPPFGITDDAEGHSQPWNVVKACADCGPDLEERVAELEATTARKGNKKVSVTLSGWVIKNDGAFIDQFRIFAAPEPTPDHTPTIPEVYDGAICDWGAQHCQLISGNDHDATVTGEATLVTDVQPRFIGVGIDGTPLFDPPGEIQYDVLVKPTPDATTSVSLRTPWLANPLPPGVVTPETAPEFMLSSGAAKRLGLTVDPSQLRTFSDASQLPVGDDTRSIYAGYGFLIELLNYYTKLGIDANNPSAAPPGTTVFFSESFDVFDDEEGRDQVHLYLDSQVKNSPTAKIVRHGSGATPTLLQSTANGVTTTTSYFDTGRNALTVFRSACNQCSAKQAQKELITALTQLRRQQRGALLH